MCHWKKWIWPGILSVGILALLALWSKSTIIEQNLQAKATQALSAEGQGWASIEMDGRDAIIRGAAPSEEARDIAELVTDEAYDVRIVDNQTDLMAAQSPYILSAKRNGNSVELSGFAPDQATREKIAAVAKEAFGGAEINNGLTLARGAPEGLTAMAGFGLSQLSALKSGEMSLSDSSLSIKGAAADFDSYNAVSTALAGTLPGGASLSAMDITAPAVTPYTWSADYDGGKVSLDGFVPSPTIRSALMAKVKAVLPSAEIIDNQKIASGASAGFEEAALFSIDQLPRLSKGKVSLSDTALSISGVSRDSTTFDKAKSAIGGALPAGLSLAADGIKPSAVSPYSWNAKYDGQTVTLGGYVPDGQTRAAIIADAKTKLPSATVIDEMQTAAGSSEGFVSATEFALGQLPRFSSGSVSLNDSKVSIAGVSRNSASFEAAKNAMSSALPAGLSLASEKIVPSTVSPYEWNAKYDGKALTLGGYVPDFAVRAAILKHSQSKLPSATIVDKMQTAAGAPADFSSATDFALNQLSRFSSGQVGLTDKQLSVEGVSLDAASFDAANGAMSAALPAGLSLASANVVPPTVTPYAWSADYDGKSLTLGGNVPDAETRSAIIASANANLPSVAVKDNMQLAIGAPADFTTAVDFALGQLSGLSSGRVGLDDKKLSVSGVARDSGAFTGAKSALSGALPAGMSMASDKIVPATVSPYTWSAEYDGKAVTLDGYVPDNAARSSILETVKANVPEAAIIDNLQIAAGAPASYGVATTAAISLLPQLSKGALSLSDAALSVKGTAVSAADFAKATAAVNANLGDGVTLAEADIKPAPVVVPKDYIWSAERRGNAVILSGNAPSKQARLNIGKRAKALFKGSTVVNRLIPREDAPVGFQWGADRGLALLNRLKTGKTSIVNQSLSLSGQASSVNNFEAVQMAMSRGLNYGYAWGERKITPVVVSPYTWSLNNSGDSVEQSGFVPSRGFGNSMIAASRATLNKEIVDKQRVAAGEPENFGNAVAAAIDAANKLDVSSVSITNTNIFVQGRAASEADAGRIQGEIETAIPSNFKLRSQISYLLPKVEAPKVEEPKVAAAAKVETPKPPVCDINFVELFAGKKINFTTNRALITENSHGLLDRIAKAALTCPDAKFEVGGHTDSRGRDTFNQELSEARAQAVVDYLIKAGVAGENLTAKGYGEGTPIADNSNIEGRAANRRIEFKILSN